MRACGVQEVGTGYPRTRDQVIVMHAPPNHLPWPCHSSGNRSALRNVLRRPPLPMALEPPNSLQRSSGLRPSAAEFDHRWAAQRDNLCNPHLINQES